MKIINTVALRDNGARIPAGTVCDYPEEIAQQLIKEGSAVLADPPQTITPPVIPAGTPPVGGADGQPAGTPADTTGKKNDETPAAGGSGNPVDDEAVKQAAALDSQYNKENLIAAAKEAGVDFAYDAKKAEIIAAVIAQGKAEALIK